MKRILFTLFAIAAMCGSASAQGFDFSAVAPSGQMLYYNIIDGGSDCVTLSAVEKKFGDVVPFVYFCKSF